METTRKWRRAITAVAVTGVLATGAIIPAVAQDGTGATEEETTQETMRGERRAAHREAFAEALATELGIDQERVESALETVHEQLQEQRRTRAHEVLSERLDQAVEDGALTREQADAILEAHDSDVFPFGRRGPRGHRGGFGPGPTSSDA